MHHLLNVGRFAKFSVVGAGGTGLHYIILVVAVEVASAPPAIASALGAVAGALFNYFLNFRFTFRSQRAHRHAFPRFLSIALLGVLLNGFVVLIGTTLGAHYFVSQLAATAIVLVVGYVMNSLWTF